MRQSGMGTRLPAQAGNLLADSLSVWEDNNMKPWP